MTTEEMPRILHALYEAIDDVNSMLPNGQKLECSGALVLHGPGSLLDSITFINFLIAAEDRMAGTFGLSPQFTVLFETTDPERYRTLEDFARFAAGTLKAMS